MCGRCWAGGFFEFELPCLEPNTKTRPAEQGVARTSNWGLKLHNHLDLVAALGCRPGQPTPALAHARKQMRADPLSAPRALSHACPANPGPTHDQKQLTGCCLGHPTQPCVLVGTPGAAVVGRRPLHPVKLNRTLPYPCPPTLLPLFPRRPSPSRTLPSPTRTRTQFLKEHVSRSPGSINSSARRPTTPHPRFG